MAIGQVVLLWDRNMGSRMPQHGGAGTGLETHRDLAANRLCDLGLWDIPEC